MNKIHKRKAVKQTTIRIETSPKEIADFISELKNRRENEIKTTLKIDGDTIRQAVQTAIRGNGAREV